MADTPKTPPPEVQRFLHMFVPIGPVEARRMFGGHGLFLDGLMVAIVYGGHLYLKADGESEARFREAGGERFTYLRQGKEVALNFWRPPERAIEHPGRFLEWAKEAVNAAQRAEAQKKNAARRSLPRRSSRDCRAHRRSTGPCPRRRAGRRW